MASTTSSAMASDHGSNVPKASGVEDEEEEGPRFDQAFGPGRGHLSSPRPPDLAAEVARWPRGLLSPQAQAGRGSFPPGSGQASRAGQPALVPE